MFFLFWLSIFVFLSSYSDDCVTKNLAICSTIVVQQYGLASISTEIVKSWRRADFSYSANEHTFLPSCINLELVVLFVYVLTVSSPPHFEEKHHNATYTMGKLNHPPQLVLAEQSQESKTKIVAYHNSIMGRQFRIIIKDWQR